MKKLFYYLLTAACSLGLLLSAGCKSDTDGPEKPGNDNDKTLPSVSFCKGADISWLSEMEAKGYSFRYQNGMEGDCIDILKSMGVNAVRLRLWVNPAGGYNTLADVKSKARRAQESGLPVMIDFHYSDTWADPGQQAVPAAWSRYDIDGLVKALYDYTESACKNLKSAQIYPQWVQIGNETNNGMLWPLGQADIHPENYVRLSNAGYEAVKSVFPGAKVIIHLADGWNSDLYRWLFDIMKRYGGKYDVIGMSLYPDPDNYKTLLSQCQSNMAQCIARYNKDVMLCEVGMGESYVSQCRDFLDRAFALETSVGRHYLGLFYWEPECYGDFNGYRKGCFTSRGAPTAAMDAFSYSPMAHN